MSENFEINNNKLECNKYFILQCFEELNQALPLQGIAPLSPCQQLAMSILRDDLIKWLENDDGC